METTNSMPVRVSRFFSDRYAYRTQPGYLSELLAFGMIVFIAVWPSRSRDCGVSEVNAIGSTVMVHQVHTYADLRKQIHDDLRIQHPEWIQPNGQSPLCDSYEARLMKTLQSLNQSEGNNFSDRSSRQLEQRRI